MDNPKPSVLACVTSQFECDRIIKKAREIADDCDCELKVLSVLKPTYDYSNVAEQIEYLHLVSKQADADMTIIFHEDAPKAVTRFANENNVQRIVTGMHDGKEDSFLVMFNRYSPFVSITMVSKSNKLYSMELNKTHP